MLVTLLGVLLIRFTCVMFLKGHLSYFGLGGYRVRGGLHVFVY